MKYCATYKCQLCGKLLFGESVEVPSNQLSELLVRVIRNQTFSENPYLHKAPLYVPCKCDNNNAGLAYFAGFVHHEHDVDESITTFF